MRKLRLAALVASGALAFAMPSAHAGSSEPPPIVKQIVNGCYGAVVTVCDVGVTSAPVEFYDRTEPVCAITCTYAVISLVRFSGDPLCVGWTSSSGTPTEYCPR